MRAHPLDSAFKDGLQGNSAQVPAGVWESVQAQLPPPKTGKGTPLVWFLGSALIIALIGALALWPDSVVQENQVKDKSSEQEVQQSFAAVTNDSDIREASAVQSNMPTAGTTESSVSNNDHIAKNKFNNNTQGELSRSPESMLPVAHQPEISEDKPSATSNEELASPMSNEKDVAIQNKSSKESNTILIEEENLSDKNTDKLNTGDQNKKNEINIAQIYPLDTEVKYEMGIGLKVTDCYAFDKKSSGQFFVEVYTGPTFSIRNLSSRGENVDDYISVRDSTESSQLSLHAGLRVGYEHKSGLTGRAGIQYTLVNEVFKQETKYSRLVIESIFDSNGDLIRIDTTLETGTRVKQTQNRYHAIDIPLLVGYRIDNGNWDIGIQAGPIFNIAFNAKGDMINPTTGMVGSFSDTTDPDYHAVFKDKIGVSIYASVYASKRIADKLWAFVEPHLQYRLKSITLDSYPVEQKQTNIGLSIGLRYKF